jgi:acyl-coenzyme A thioesterase PaaI-like protein
MAANIRRISVTSCQGIITDAAATRVYNRAVSDTKVFSDNDYCFACGSKNPLGMQLTFSASEDGSELTTRVTPSPHWQGFAGVMHGGLQATVMDDLMSNYLFRLKQVFVVTGELKVRYRRPVPLDCDLLFRTRVGAHEGRVWTMIGECLAADDETGQVLTIAEGRFFEIEPPAPR